jgi:hypothetical protein
MSGAFCHRMKYIYTYIHTYLVTAKYLLFPPPKIRTQGHLRELRYAELELNYFLPLTTLQLNTLLCSVEL